jgi:signal peptide peptidase SppA
VDNDRIKAVVLDIDSPGGTTSGVELAADRVFAARGSKPIVAVANSQAGSAAYWIGSSASSFVATPGADVGSIGVFRVHENHQAALEQAGVEVSFIARPEFKTEGNPFEPLSEEARTFHQDQVDATFAIFNRAVARGRGVSAAESRENFGKGRMFHADQAAKLGLVDRVASLPKVLSELGVGTGRARTSDAAEVAALTRELCEAWWEGVAVQETDAVAFPAALKRARLRQAELEKS